MAKQRASLPAWLEAEYIPERVDANRLEGVRRVGRRDGGKNVRSQSVEILHVPILPSIRFSGPDVRAPRGA